MRKLRVALVAPSIDLPGGQSVQAEQLVRAWRGDPDVEASLIPIHWAPPHVFSATKHVKFLRSAAMEVDYLPRLVPGLVRADVAHIFGAPYAAFLLAPLPAILTARALGRPFVINYRNGEAPDHLRRSAIARAALRRAEHVVVPSQYLVNVLERFGIRAVAITNIVDVDRFRFRARAPLGARILSTRNLHDLYNVGCTIRAFRIVQDHRPDASLTVVGGGPTRGALEHLVRELRLEHVQFIGRVSHDAIADVYAAHDIYIQSPNADNLPNSVIEAIASGLPVVSTAAGGVATMITHGEHGLLAPVNDHRLLGAHVLRLLNEPAFARRLAYAAYEVARKTYQWTNVRDEWLRVYSRAVSVPARRPALTPAGPAI